MTSSIPQPRYLPIFSQFTLQKALKNYPKHFKALHLETESYPTPKILSKPLLKSLFRRSKSLRALSLEKYEQLLDLKPSKTLSLIKSFPHIKSLTLPGDNDKHFFIKLYIKWLKRSKRLLHITSGNIPISFQMRLRRAPFKDLSLLESFQIKYKRTFQRTRILSFTLQSHEISSKSDIPSPSSLKKLSISSYFLVPSFQLNLPHLPNLSILHLNLPISFLHLLDTLHSLPNLTHLTARISDIFNRANKQTFKIPESLVYFQSLQSLYLEIKSFLFISSLLKSFKNPENLHQLALQIPLRNEEELLELASSIGNLPNLSHLAIKNSKSVQGRASEGHWELFHQISRLTKLKSLEISLYGEKTVMPSSGIFYGSLGKFANCVDSLGELQEITFSQSEICLEDELYLLASVLGKKGSKLKKLRLTFVNRDNDIDHLEILNKAIFTMKNLEEVRLEGVSTRKESFAPLCDVVSELKWLRSVFFDFIETGLDRRMFTKIAREILMKYGLEEVKWFDETKMKGTRKDEPIDIKEVLMRNPQLQRIAFRSYPKDEEILSFVNKDMIAS